MSTQPEALRLADAICDYSRYGHETEDAAKRRRHIANAQAANELRRLHEAHDWQYKMAGERLRRIEKLEKVNQELLEALKEIMSWEENEQMTWAQKARAAIAKATGEQA